LDSMTRLSSLWEMLRQLHLETAHIKSRAELSKF
jgi:hypothetical protein